MLQDVSVTDFRRGFEKASRFKADPVFDADKRFCGSYTGDCLGQIKQHPRDAAEVVRSEQVSTAIKVKSRMLARARVTPSLPVSAVSCILV